MQRIKNMGKYAKYLLAVLLAWTVLTGFLTEAEAAEPDVDPVSVSQINARSQRESFGLEEGAGRDEKQEVLKSTELVEWKKIALKEPEGFQAEAVKNGIWLSWEKCGKGQKYELYRKTAGSSKYTLIKTTKKNSFTDTKAKYGVTYTYKIRTAGVFDGKTYTSGCSETRSCCSFRIDPSKPMVALTYDDGPSMYTQQILDTLKKYNGRATFFEVGNRVALYPQTVKRISEMGCELGNHSYDHANLGIADASKVQTELSRTDSKIKSLTGKTPSLIRPPYGSIGNNLRNHADRPLILWSIDTLDWKTRNASSVYCSVMNHVKDGDIILMHDLYLSTANASSQMIPELVRRGYQLVTVSELAQYKKIALHAGQSYSRM